jgi:hypothetical protein
VARPEGIEPPTLCLEAARPTLPNLARGVANRANSTSWGNSTQTTFSFVFHDYRPFCCSFPQLALRFCDSVRFRYDRSRHFLAGESAMPIASSVPEEKVLCLRKARRMSSIKVARRDLFIDALHP